MTDVTASFTGSIPEHYDRHLGPAYFDAFADDLAQRLPVSPPGDVLEIACGTGLVTRHLRSRLDSTRTLIATDLSAAMLAYARAKLQGVAGIEWQEADAMRMPFPDTTFGAVACGFGVMFVPDKAKALAEVRRVLRRNGVFLFSVWDRIDRVAHAVGSAQAMERLFPGDAEMRFPLPYEMHDPALLRSLLAAAGFTDIRIDVVQRMVGPVSARSIATGAVRGTPRSLLIEKRGVSLDTAVDAVTAALTEIGGDPFRGSAQALVVAATYR